MKKPPRQTSLAARSRAARNSTTMQRWLVGLRLGAVLGLVAVLLDAWYLLHQVHGLYGLDTSWPGPRNTTQTFWSPAAISDQYVERFLPVNTTVKQKDESARAETDTELADDDDDDGKEARDSEDLAAEAPDPAEDVGDQEAVPDDDDKKDAPDPAEDVAKDDQEVVPDGHDEKDPLNGEEPEESLDTDMDPSAEAEDPADDAAEGNQEIVPDDDDEKKDSLGGQVDVSGEELAEQNARVEAQMDDEAKVDKDNSEETRKDVIDQENEEKDDDDDAEMDDEKDAPNDPNQREDKEENNANEAEQDDAEEKDDADEQDDDEEKEDDDEEENGAVDQESRSEKEENDKVDETAEEGVVDQDDRKAAEMTEEQDDDEKNANTDDNATKEKKNDGKARIVRLLREAGFSYEDIDDKLMASLPTWSQVADLYGDEPYIVGTDTCQQFRDTAYGGDASEHFLAVAGTFNSGTNYLAELLIQNCQIAKRMEKYGPESKGIRWQVRWGKHEPVDDEEHRRNHHVEKDIKHVDQVLPVVAIRDPGVWMPSMCRHEYGMIWPHDASRHCPNLVPNQVDWEIDPYSRNKKSVPVYVKYSNTTRRHASMLHHWNDWYKSYYEASFPRLMVRFEDLVFHTQHVVKVVCECAGGEMQQHPFQYIVDSAKKGDAHGTKEDKTGYLRAIIKYGTEHGRWSGMTQDDMKFARDNLNADLMRAFRYQGPVVRDDLLSEE